MGSLKDITYPNRARKTRRQQSLEQMDQIMSWALLLTFLCLHHPNGEQGRRLIPQEVMVRIYFMQQQLVGFCLVCPVPVALCVQGCGYNS